MLFLPFCFAPKSFGVGLGVPAPERLGEAEEGGVHGSGEAIFDLPARLLERSAVICRRTPARRPRDRPSCSLENWIAGPFERFLDDRR